jgi:galactonate dehydratase
VNRLGACDEIALASIKVEAGWAEMTTAPGLGIDIDAERLRQRPYRDYPPKGRRHYWQEYPSKSYAVPSILQGAGGTEAGDGAK